MLQHPGTWDVALQPLRASLCGCPQGMHACKATLSGVRAREQLLGLNGCVPPVPVQDPVSYAQKALAINEFGAPRWQAVLTPSGQPVGEVVLAQRGLPGPGETWCALHAHMLQVPCSCVAGLKDVSCMRLLCAVGNNGVQDCQG